MASNYPTLAILLNEVEQGKCEIISLNKILKAISQDLNIPNDKKWGEENRPEIKNIFEKVCSDLEIICQESTIGPFKGGYWVIKKSPALTPKEMWPYQS